jgi:hypothetical protein
VLFDDGVIGMPHIFDSVALTCVSPGAHIAAFCSGVNDDVMFPWAWAILKILNSPTARLAAKMPIIDITLKDVFLHDIVTENIMAVYRIILS